MSFEIRECYANDIKFEGLFEIVPKIFYDERGFFFESYNEKIFSALNIKTKFVQDNISFSRAKVIRAFHFQKQNAQAKLVTALSGKIFDVQVDLRNDSKTFGCWHGVVLDSDKKNQIYIPRGFAHGFLALTDAVSVFYKCDNFYDACDESGILWCDNFLKVSWQENSPIVSKKDRALPLFDKNKKYFSMQGLWLGEKTF